jgi:hypothetical protein
MTQPSACPAPPQVLDIRGLRPEHLVVTHIAVPPVAIRPSVDMDGTSNEDDITMKLAVSSGGGGSRSGVPTGLPYEQGGTGLRAEDKCTDNALPNGHLICNGGGSR